MERIRQCDNYQKFILILLVLMTVGFIVPYAATVSRVGYEYHDVILIPAEENGNTLYSGQIDGQTAVFTVAPNNTVTFQYGSKTYGPYSVRQEPSLSTTGHYGNGIEVRCDGKLIFRGSVRRTSNGLWLTNEDGTSYSGGIIIAYSGGGVVTDGDGNVIDTMEPGITTILKLLEGPELTHKGSWGIWFCGALLCGMTAVSILFADELFRLHLVFRVRDVYAAEPSDWELGSRYISWTVMPILALILFFKGLQ